VSLAPHLTGAKGPTRDHNFSQMFFVPEPPGSPTPGINASATDTRYKLTCKLLTNQALQPVDRDGNPTKDLVLDYEFSRLDPEPGIPGSSVETPIQALSANPDGSFRVSDLRYQSKLLELQEVLSRSS
jgi:hypothetical protein